MRLGLKVAILKTGKTQRQVALDARMTEGRLSELVCGKSWPTSSERSALKAVLGADPFRNDQHRVEVRSGRGR